MKRLLFTLMAAVCMAGLANAQVLYTQAFEGTAPWDMTTVDNAGSGNVWQRNDYAGYSTSTANNTGGTGFSASANSDGLCDGSAWDTYLYSPAIDVSSVSSATVSFKSNFQDFVGAGDAEFAVSTDGVNWTVLYAQTADDGPTSLSYDLTPYVGGNVYLRWRYDDDADGCAWYWQIDDVSVFGGGGGGGTSDGGNVHFQSSCGLNIAIADASCPTQTTATVTASGLTTLGTTTSFVSVDIIMDHTWDSDLDIYLISPAGTIVELSTDNGVAEEDFGVPFGDCSQFTRFTMLASTSITTGAGPFLGSYLPEGDLGVFDANSEDPNGTWTLRVCDDAGGDVGTIEYFAVNFDYSAPPPVYCTPTVTFVDEFNEFISNFSLNTINNASSYDISGYQDFTSLSTQLQIGVPYTASINIGPPSYADDVMDVWADLNHDGDFDDAGELLIDGTINAGGVATDNLILPTGSLTGTTTLRVATRWASTFGGDITALPCGPMQYGEYEDYTIDVLPAPACLAPVTLSATNITTTSAVLNWNLVPGGATYTVQYREVGSGTWITLGTYTDPTNSATLSGLNPQTQYEFQVQTDCGGGSTSTWSLSELFSTSCFDCPVGATAEAENCGDDTNGGCNMLTPTYEPIAANSSVCGTGWASGGTRDTDWYSFTLAQASTVTLDIQSDFPPLAGFLDGSIDCSTLSSFISSVAVDQTCADTTLTVSLCAGTYYVFVAPAAFDGFPCGASNNYNITLTVTPGTSGPTNVSACSAIELPVGSSCNPQTFDNTGAVYCSGGLDPGCGFYQGQDIWFYAIVPSSGNLTILGTAGTLDDGAMGVYTGTDCNNIALYNCNDDFTQNSLDPGMQLFGLTPGDTVWIQYFQFGGGTGTFDICAFDCNVVPGSGTAETELCGEDLNGGCNSIPAVYQNISCNETINGTGFSNDQLRDTDWYLYTITTPTVVSWTVQADFPPAAAILNTAYCDDQFNPAFVVGFVTGNPCSPLTVTAYLQPGTYAFFVAPSVFDATYDCSTGLNDYIATLNVQMPSPAIGGPATVCVGDAPFDYVAATAGGQWSTSTGLGFADANVGTFDPAAAGVGPIDIYYTINQNGCTVADTVSIVIGDVPAQPATPTGTAQLCPGAGVQTYTIPAVANADSYNWIVTPTNSGATVTNNGTTATIDWGSFTGVGSIVVEAVNECGTSAPSASFDVTIVPAVGTAGNPVGPTVICQGTASGQYVTSGATGADSYNWVVTPAGAYTSINGNGTNTLDINWNLSFTGNVTITVTPSNSCGNGGVGSTTVAIQVPGNASITAVAPVCSNAAPFNLSATPAGGTWSGNGITDAANGTFDPSVAGAGNHTVVYTPQGGCATPANTTITVNGLPAQGQAPVGATAFCQGAGPINVFAPPIQDATSYTWSFTPSPNAGSFSSNGTNGTITLDPDFCGQISLIIAGNNQCGTGLYSLPLLIDVTCTPAPVIDPAGPFCVSNNQYPLTVDISGGFWGGCANSNGTFTPATEGTCTVTYTAIVNGCVGSGSQSVTVGPAPTVTITTPATICEGSAPVTLTAFPNGGTWSSNAPGGVFDPANGSDDVTYTLSGQNGCDGSATEYIDVVAAPVAQFSYSAQCEALTFFDESDNATSWFWTFGDGEESSFQNTSHVYNQDGNVQVTLTATNACGSSDTTMTVVIIKCVSVDEDVVSDLKLYPNPTSGMVNLFFNSLTAKNYNISIVDITGKVLFALPLNNYVGAFNRQLDLSGYAAGIYMLRIVDEKGNSTNFKVIRD